MRKSVRIKNFIAKTMIAISVIAFLMVASDPVNMTGENLVLTSGSLLLGFFGYQLWRW